MNASLSRAYGLLCSTNFSWPWCPTSIASHADVRITLGSLARFSACSEADYRKYAHRGSATNPIVAVDRGLDGHFRVSYADGARFVIAADLDEVYGVSQSELTLDDLLVYLQGPILGLLLRLRGMTCLHASGVVVDGRAIAIVGSGGMGKSTTAATFALLGVPVLTDDVLALRDRNDSFHVFPGLPRILLWPESVEALFGNAEALPKIVSTWGKRYLDLAAPSYRFAELETPLGAIYFLGDRLEGAAETEISALGGTSALLPLLANTYANDFLDASLRAKELAVLARLISQVPIRQVRAPQDRTALPQICKAIVADAHALLA